MCRGPIAGVAAERHRSGRADKFDIINVLVRARCPTKNEMGVVLSEEGGGNVSRI